MTVAKSLPHLWQKVRKLLIPKLFLSYSCILQKKQSIATSSALNEEAKKQLAELAEKLEAAQNEYKDAVAAQTALQNSINNATDAWNVALDVKN